LRAQFRFSRGKIFNPKTTVHEKHLEEVLVPFGYERHEITLKLFVPFVFFVDEVLLFFTLIPFDQRIRRMIVDGFKILAPA